MKNYQAMILGGVIASGAFVLGMNSVDVVKIQETPIQVTDKRSANPVYLDANGHEYDVELEYVTDIRQRFIAYETAIFDPDALDDSIPESIRIQMYVANKNTRKGLEFDLKLACRSYDRRYHFDENRDPLLYNEAETICNMVGELQ